MDKAPNEYLRNAVLTATPEQLHLMLYDGAIRFTRRGVEGLEKKDLEGAYQGFSRAQRIVLEMLNALNYDIDEALCKRMAGLYQFIYNKLLEASVEHSASSAAEALRILEYQRETWVMLINRLQNEQAGARPPSSDSSDNGLADALHGTLSVEG